MARSKKSTPASGEELDLTTSAKAKEEVTPTKEIEVKEPETVEAPKEEVVAKPAKIEWDIKKLATQKTITVITNYINKGAVDSTELEALLDSCVK
ncbi:hypothetical protein Phi19:3_gp071 [Cellulophaga phage phi19:3]|uniref:Uncharacterized protein n=1 Tax=Cellulophaga phage phi19:3 TaxID=1327971 RepID=R9ZY88_9CAUD|nr:hypothetical protein Phi19:3_gp071 [Cellulophaga phage phi19:3]AGO47475.1 hypothetical protein Phi19:3_gp071 [Cellulophaga phage phi19:3]